MRALIVLTGIYGFVRTVASLRFFLTGHALFNHDLHHQYLFWSQFISRSTAAEPLSSLSYLPHTWMLLTPLFCLGWPVASVIWFVVSVALHCYIWWRISEITKLTGLNRWLFLTLYFCFVSVGISMALGNLVIASFACVLAAYPFRAKTRTWTLLFVASIKHSLVYPVFLTLLIKRPRTVLIPMVAIGVTFLAAMAWAGLSPFSIVGNLKRGYALAEQWSQGNPISVVHIVKPLFKNPLIAQALIWTVWLAGFACILTFIKNRFIRLAALLLISLLPMYHRFYDLIVATPIVALLIRYERVGYALAVTALLSGVWDWASNRHFFGLPGANAFLAFDRIYGPVVIIFLTLTAFYIARIKRLQPIRLPAPRNEKS